MASSVPYPFLIAAAILHNTIAPKWDMATIISRQQQLKRLPGLGDHMSPRFPEDSEGLQKQLLCRSEEITKLLSLSNMSVSRKFALIGSGAAGKTSIARRVATMIPIKLLDIDDLFVNQYGSIAVFGAKHGWRSFFELQGELTRSALVSIAAKEPGVLIVMPASSLCHEEYIDVCAHTLAAAKATANLICVLADRDHHEGARLSVQRQSTRGYDFSASEKARQYVYQSQFYQGIANRVLFNSTTLDDAAIGVCKIIKELRG